jgi:hypothetical protein
MKKLNLFILALCMVLLANAQTLERVQQDTVYLNLYKGIEKYQIDTRAGNRQKQGIYSFKSEPAFSPDYSRIDQLQIQGNFENGKYQGSWEYKVGEYLVSLKGIQDSRQLNIDLDLNGVERVILLNYHNGQPQGNWKIVNYPISNNRRQGETEAGNFQFEKGLAVGKFNFKGFYQDLSILGQLNDQGFLDGELTLEYVIENEKFKEIRNYKDGFLLKISIFKGADFSEQIKNVVYEEVATRLEHGLGTGGNGVKVSIGEKGFGVQFQNGYASDHEKLTVQTIGNFYIQDFIDRFQKFGKNHSEAREEPQFNFTRRFKYEYPSSEDSVLRYLAADLRAIENEVSDLLANPRILLYQAAFSDLAFPRGFLIHARGKAAILLEVTELLQSDSFDFAYRPNFFPEGILGLNAPDHYSYEENQIQKEALFDVGVFIDSPDHMIEKMQSYATALKSEVISNLGFIYEKTKVLDEQSTLDSLDSQIFLKSAKVDALYSFFQQIPDGVSEKDFPLDFRIYRSFKLGLLQELRNEYLEEKVMERKIFLGKTLISWLLQFEQSYSQISLLNGFSERMDRYFTRYSPNPFFEREIETKVLPQIYGKSTTLLFQQYLRNLVSSRKIEDLDSNLKKIENLELRLVELSKQYNDPEVIAIDRALRRENSSARIERILKL